MIKYALPTMNNIKEKEKKALFNVVSLFAGGGGSSTGYRMAGGRILGISEFISKAIETYKANYPETIVFDKDIRKLETEEILKSLNLKVNELDILDGSPPCASFSSSGAREKMWGKEKKYSDSSQVTDDLFFEYIRILKGLKPKIFIAENVKGLATGKAKGYLNEILRELKSTGYVVKGKILDAKYFGVPQTRNRLILCGVRKDLWRDEYKGRLHPKPINRFITLKDAFNELVITEQEKKETSLVGYKNGELLKTLKPGTSHKKRFNLIKCSKNNVSDCITATTGKIGAANPCHWDNRAFTEREIKRIMSVPDDYINIGTWQQKIERLGRMVPPLMMKAIAENIYINILSKINV